MNDDDNNNKYSDDSLFFIYYGHHQRKTGVSILSLFISPSTSQNDARPLSGYYVRGPQIHLTL